MTNIMQNPKFSTVLGLLLESAGTDKIEENKESSHSDIVSRLGDSLKSVFKEIF